MPTLIPSVRQAVLNGQPFDIGYNRSGKKFVQIRSAWDQFFHIKDTAYHTNKMHRIVKVLSKALRDMPKCTIHEAMQHQTVNTARQYLRTLKPKQYMNPKVRECCRFLLAAKLGIDRDIFNHNPGFETFAFKSHIDRYLMDYNHSLKVDPTTKELSILHNGAYQPWSVVYTKFQESVLPKPNFPGNPQQMWCYGPKGIQKEDMYAWNELKPYKVVKNHDWGNRFIFEFCACCKKDIQMNGAEHSWLRLKTPNGEIYCVGFYRPGKSHLLDNFHLPLRAKKGYLMSPDVSEFWPIPIHRIPVEITKEQFEKIKFSLEEDKKNEESLVFQLFNGNCTEYINSKAKLAGIRLPTAVHYLRNVTPLSIQQGYDRVMDKLPSFARKICEFVVMILSNLLQICLGGHLLDRQLKGKNIPFKTNINSFSDFFNPKKLEFHPPRYLAHTVGKEIEEWRKTEAEKLLKKVSFSDNPDSIKKAVENIQYALPKKFYCSN